MSNSNVDFYLDWNGICSLCLKETPGTPYMALVDAKLICRECFDIQKKNSSEKNPTPYKKNKVLAPGMEWELPDNFEYDSKE